MSELAPSTPVDGAPSRSTSSSAPGARSTPSAPSASSAPSGTVPSSASAAYAPGLEGVVAAETRLSRVDGAAGRLEIGGYPLESLAGRASFEEVLFLLWTDRPPEAPELDDLRAALAARRDLPAATLDLLRAAATAAVPPMNALRMAAATLDLPAATEGLGGDGRAASRDRDAGAGAGADAGADAGVAFAADADLDSHMDADAARLARLAEALPPAVRPLLPDALGVVARFPTILAAYLRLRAGQEPVAPRPDLGHAAHLLWSLDGLEPAPARTRGLETYLVTVSDHGLNASTFTARVITSTGSDLVSAVTGAVGALKGPLHGGAPGPALDMVLEIGAPERAEAEIRARLARGERLMGFGHRVYRVRDPRAEVLGAAAEEMLRASGEEALLDLARAVEAEALRALRAHKPGRRIETNVEFYTALLLHGLGLPSDAFPAVFAVGRAAGWTAHAMEQAEAGRLIRPRAAYVGARGRKWAGAA